MAPFCNEIDYMLMNQRRKRTPKGVFDTKPIALRLMPHERIEAEQLSREQGKTKSAFARETYLAGMAMLTRSKNSAAPSSPAESPGGKVATSPDRAALFTTQAGQD